MKKDIYSKEIMEIWKNPKNFGKLKNPSHKIDEANTICGDEMEIYLEVEDNIIKDAKFFSTGCLICIVFASELTEKIKGMKVEDAYNLRKKDLLDLLNLNITPMKAQCASLSLEALKNCLNEGKIEKS